ncbi:hypothetical protein IRZ71_02310 [Flavobacterium sp. ANB]|uniref:hypothetical protein n=1 Tax=unclassified Flavobacterium TaxID=196869 RepID=UPI0012B7F949|nr:MULTISPECIES: hypothetical protein [unclassified Flavobacterium]MBF4515154.1 hypothetical protein [Flavobacterium sp. ANB]MTD70066.1 hypothetical protein [Flavobacterium sp. LC2016-13]
MNLEDFIENANGLDVVALESKQLKEINGGIGRPVPRIVYQETAEDAYLIRYYPN